MESPPAIPPPTGPVPATMPLAARLLNIRLVSVTKQAREVGIRRAVGAKKRNILTQFILEAVVLCEPGGAVGVTPGVAGVATRRLTC